MTLRVHHASWSRVGGEDHFRSLRPEAMVQVLIQLPDALVAVALGVEELDRTLGLRREILERGWTHFFHLVWFQEEVQPEEVYGHLQG